MSTPSEDVLETLSDDPLPYDMEITLGRVLRRHEGSSTKYQAESRNFTVEGLRPSRYVPRKALHRPGSFTLMPMKCLQPLQYIRMDRTLGYLARETDRLMSRDQGFNY